MNFEIACTCMALGPNQHLSGLPVVREMLRPICSPSQYAPALMGVRMWRVENPRGGSMKSDFSSLPLRWLGKETMRNVLVLALMCAGVFSTLCQSQNHSPEYQKGTITAAVRHETAQSSDDSVPRYDVSIKAGDTVYVVLYTPLNGVDTIKYKAGMNLLVWIEKDTMTFHDLLGRTIKVPILRRDLVPAHDAK